MQCVDAISRRKCTFYLPVSGSSSWMKRFCAESNIDVKKYVTCSGDSGGRK